MNKKQTKYSLRKYYLDLRKSISKEVNLLILSKVEIYLRKFINKGKEGVIGIYWPLDGEIDIRSLKDNFDTTFALPSCEKDGKMFFRRWTNSKLRKDNCGITASLDEEALNPEEITLIFLPALAIDRNGTRLGYGGGYFDRLRGESTWKGINYVVVLPEICVCNSFLEIDPWDIPFEEWITENGEYRANP
tara:strand:- start:187 stop:756 length:570 start_codon:yes stop_codon:yes gene_type:complete